MNTLAHWIAAGTAAGSAWKDSSAAAMPTVYHMTTCGRAGGGIWS